MRKTLIGMAAVLVAAGLSALACSAPVAEEPTSTPVPTLEPPVVASTAVGIQGPSIDLPVGETYEIALDSNPTTGYGWQVEFNDWDLELVEQRYEPESDSDAVGAGGTEVYVFRGRTVSSGDVVFTYKRSWEDEVLKTERYTFDVLTGRFDEMSLSEAMAIASESECVDAGPLKESAYYNKFTGTWWIDLDAEKEFCPSPACVVNVATKEAEINWRCMGALPPREDGTEPEQPAGSIEIEPHEMRAPSGPLDTALAEVTLLSSHDDLTRMLVGEIRDYQRVPGAANPELSSGDEVLVRIHERAAVGPDASEGAQYLATMSLCLSEFLGGLECQYEGWSVALYPLTARTGTTVSGEPPPPESGIFFPRQEPPVGPRESMLALFFGELVEVDGCLRARDTHDDYLVIWPHDHSLNVEEGAIQILDETGEVAVEVGDRVRLSGGEAMSLDGDERLQDVAPAHCPGRYWIVGTEVARLQDVLLEVQQVIDLPDAARVRVQGHLVVEGEASVKLCRILLESDPPQCGEPSLSIEGLDLGAIPGLQTSDSTTWSPDFVELTGVVQDGVLTVD